VSLLSEVYATVRYFILIQGTMSVDNSLGPIFFKELEKVNAQRLHICITSLVHMRARSQQKSSGLGIEKPI